ncbi:hypothetical protein StoSoilB5_22310 [Arthrobacter sp. StoSoilB5]|nr:hypothetical protein StoSoilB5_22310 [Arthrobacter sp. StoSoilB5]
MVTRPNQPLAQTQLLACLDQTIYEAVNRGLITAQDSFTLRTGGTCRHKRVRGRTREGALKQPTNLKPISPRPAVVETLNRLGPYFNKPASRRMRGPHVRGV